MEDFIDCFVLSIESEKLELRRGLKGWMLSAKVEARPSGRWRNGERLFFAVPFA